MRWTLQPLRYLRAAAATASAFTICLTPVAQGQERERTQKELVNQYLKDTGISTKKGLTVGEYWRSIRHVYPYALQSKMDLWVSTNRNMAMPKVEATTYKDRDGKQQIRLNLIGKPGQSMSITFTGNEENPIKFNNTAISKKEISDFKNFNKMLAKIGKENPALAKANKDSGKTIAKNPVLSYKEFSALTAKQKASYLVKVRLAMQSAERVFTAKYGKTAALELENKYEWAFKFLAGEDAQAASSLSGKPCVYAGYLTLYGENGSCGGEAEGARHFSAAIKTSMASCSGGAIPCNPMVYGYDANGGSHCVPHAQRKYATSQCNTKSPLNSPEDKKVIVESYLAKRGKNVKLNLVDGKVSEDQYKEIEGYLKDLNKFINDAVGECDNDPLLSIQKQRPDQKSACDSLRIRAFDLQKFAMNPTEVVGNPPAPEALNCSFVKPGSSEVINSQGKPECVCEVGHSEGDVTVEDGKSIPGCLVQENQDDVAGIVALPGAKEVKEKDDDDDKGGFPWLWLAAAGLIGVGIWAIFNHKNKKGKKDDKYVAPVATDPGAPAVVPPTSTINPLPNACDPATWTRINGICTPPSIVIPTPDLEGGTLVPTEGMGSGVNVRSTR